MEEEQVKLIIAYVQPSEEVEGKYEVLGQMWSNWAGNFWHNLGIFDTEELASQHKESLITK